MLSLRIRASSLFFTSVFAVAALLALLSGYGSSASNDWLSAASLGWRAPASRPFPNTSTASDVDDMLKDYDSYLQFVLIVGNGVDSRNAKALAGKWSQLRKNNPTAAARFLKGLKFEMDNHLQLVGGSSTRMTTDSPAVRAWVKRYLRDWYREADEHLFRTYAMRLSTKYNSSRAQ